MPSLIRVGTSVVNLDCVKHAILAHGFSTTVFFSGEQEDSVMFRDDAAIAVAAYLEEQAVDVLAWHAERERRKVEEAARKAAFAANFALLDHCTDQAGHTWKPAPADGFDCVSCGAHDRSRYLSEAIDCWGGAPVGTP